MLVDGADIIEMQEDVRKTAGSLQAMITDIISSSNALGTVSQSLQETSGRFAFLSQNQVDDVAHTSSAMTRIGESVDRVGKQMERVSATSGDYHFGS